MKIQKGIWFFCLDILGFLLGQCLKTINKLSLIFQHSAQAIIPYPKYAFFFMLSFYCDGNNYYFTKKGLVIDFFGENYSLLSPQSCPQSWA